MFEKVNPAHPDKVADRIAGALVDLAYANCLNPRVAIEVLIGHG
jgi:S-adenosylmethionine synthetase